MIKLFFFAIIFFFPSSSKSFGVLTHEAVIDAAWDNFLLPLLKEKYPAATSEDLKTAHAYAYGGAVCPDMGYYPLGSHLFTNLVHYVRSGDMVDSLLKDADNLNQYAFALGFLSHYLADNYGHPLATNRSVPLLYKKMRKKYGDVVTYGDNEISHLRMEFGFDVLQTAKGNYASQSYHDFIGFKIDTAVLSRAFAEVYGLNLNTIYKHHLQSSIDFFRYVIANVFPFITKTAWASKGSQLIQRDSTITSKRFRYKMHVKEYDKEYGKGYRHPGFFPALLSVFIRILPKVGPLKALKFKLPNLQSEKYFDQSFDTIEKYYGADIKRFKDEPYIPLTDEDFDTGKPTELFEYNLADKTYEEWTQKLDKENVSNISIPIRQNILSYYKMVIAKGNKNYQKKCKRFYTALNDINDQSQKVSEMNK